MPLTLTKKNDIIELSIIKNCSLKGKENMDKHDWIVATLLATATICFFVAMIWRKDPRVATPTAILFGICLLGLWIQRDKSGHGALSVKEKLPNKTYWKVVSKTKLGPKTGYFIKNLKSGDFKQFATDNDEDVPEKFAVTRRGILGFRRTELVKFTPFGGKKDAK